MTDNSTLETLKAMHCSAMALEFENQLKDSKTYDTLSFEERVGLLVDAEWNRRQKNKLQKLIKPADVEKLNEDDKIWLLDFLYENMTETDKLWCIIINSPEAFIPNIFFEVKDDIRKKYENVKIQISDSSIEFYAITGGFFVPSRQGKAVYDLKKIVFTFDEDIGLTMEEMLLEERIYK